MADSVHKPGDSSPPDASSERNPQQPYTPVNLNVDYGAPPAPGPVVEDPQGSRYLPETASPASPRNQNALNQTAEKIGALVGTAVNIFRGIERQVRSTPKNVVSIRERVRERSHEFRQDASDAAREWKQNAQVRVQQARERTAQYVHENPFQVIAAVAGIAFCAGVALRIWRSRLE